MAHGGDVAIARLVVRNASFRRLIAGSGLRRGDANISTVAPYAQVNVGVAREFLLPDDPKPMTLRFDVVESLRHDLSAQRRQRYRCIRPRNSVRAGVILRAPRRNSDAWTEATRGRRQNVDMGGSFPRWIGGATISTIASERRTSRFGGPVRRAQPISGEVKRGAVSALSAVAPSALSAALVWAQQNPQSSPESSGPCAGASLSGIPSCITVSEGSHWQQALVARLDRFECYPAQAHGAEGVASLAFTIDPNGNVLSSQIATSSGSPFSMPRCWLRSNAPHHFRPRPPQSLTLISPS